MDESATDTRLRDNLVLSLRNKGINDENVLAAIGRVPRHLFADQWSLRDAYEDKPLEIGEGQTISQPYTVAYQTRLLDIKKDDKVLEIGTGSGYQAVVLAEMGAKVYTIERQKKLYTSTKLKLAERGYSNIKVFYGDGNKGLHQFAPFDKIIVTAAAPGIPATLVEQLAVGGIMAVPVNGNIQKMLRILKVSPTETHVQEFDDFRFVPLLEGTAGEH
jgi:protein-L-isoaspartate(D-aspartate) O-methyltransferase